MKKFLSNRRIDRRAFLKEAALAGGGAIVTLAPLKVFAQGEQKRIPPMSIMYYTVIPEQEDVLKVISQDWKKLGLEVKLNVKEVAVALHTIYVDRAYGDMAALAFSGTPWRLDPNWDLEEHLHSSRAKKGWRNFGYYKNPEYDKYFELQRSELDKNKRREYVWKCQEIAAKDYPVWWIYYSDFVSAYNSRDWEDVWPMVGGGLGSMNNIWTYLRIKSKTKRNKIRVANWSMLRGLNPFSVKDAPSKGVLSWIYDTFTKVNPDLETVPWAAESWKWVNPKILEITLRSGMKFHDGKPLTVEDIKFTWDFTKKWRFPEHLWISETVERAEIINDRNVRLHLVRPHAPFVDSTLGNAIIIPKHIWETIPESVNLKNPINWDNKQCIGSGPFKLGHWRRAEELYLEANKEHWYSPKIDGIYFREKMAPDALMSALIGEEADIIAGEIRPSMGKTLEKYKYLTVVKTPNHRLWFIRADMRKKPFSDKEFRRAIYHSIDMKKLKELVFEGSGFTGRNTPIAPVFKFWHNSEIPPIDFSLDKARKILKDAGYTWDGEGRLCLPKG